MGGPSVCELSLDRSDSPTDAVGEMKSGGGGAGGGKRRGNTGDALNGDYRRPRRRAKSGHCFFGHVAVGTHVWVTSDDDPYSTGYSVV
ncbi:hypothetical protein J6590_018985 [Homalodisca vitripennis]|nr:hypothetical protein J6590_018985 [Homalodisca vitripennis]